MAETLMIKVVEHCRVSSKKSRPSSSSSSSSPIKVVNLSPFDIPLCFIIGDAANQTKRVLFYVFPNSDLLHKQVVLSLKTSLSLALENFYPYASKLVFPPFPETPRFLYTDGDSVPFTVAESTMDFGELIGDQVKDVKLFHPLVPKLSPKIISPEDDDGTLIIPDLLAIQVTVFPNSGLCIGIHYNHTVGDGTSIKNFLKSWSSICRTGSVENSVIPFHDRDVIEDAIGLQTIQVWKEWSQTFPTRRNRPTLPSNALRATFILSKTNIKRLKEWILNHQQQQPMLVSNNISSFAAACAFTWVCYVKSTQNGESDDVISSSGGELFGDIEQLHEFLFPADVRTRLKTPTLKTYFGNCLVPCNVHIDKKVLLGKHGIVYAANAISEKVKEVNDKGGAKRAFETSLPNIKVRQLRRLLNVVGSPRQAVYDTDFGWGRPKKCEMVHIDATGSISLAETKDEEGGMEIGIALESVAMNKFTTLFHSLI